MSTHFSDLDPDIVEKGPGLFFRRSDHTYWAGHPDTSGIRLDGCTTILKEAGLINTKYFTDAAAESGSFIHSAFEYYDRPDLVLDETKLDPKIQKYLVGWKKFTEECSPIWSEIEKPLFDPSLGVAGTVDRVGSLVLPGKTRRPRVVVDIKSGQSQRWHSLQLACYAHLWGRHLQLSGATDIQRTSRPFVDRFAVYVTSRGTYKVVQYKDQTDAAVFMAARTLVQWRRAHGTR